MEGQGAPLQCKTATRFFEPATQACISLETKGRIARGGALGSMSLASTIDSARLFLTDGLERGSGSPALRKHYYHKNSP